MYRQSQSEFPLVGFGIVSFFSTLMALIVFGLGVRLYLHWSVQSAVDGIEERAREQKWKDREVP